MSIHKKRVQIDKIDDDILKIINKRAKLVQDIARIKHDKKGKFYVPSREHNIYKRLKKNNKGPLSQKAVNAIFREIMSASLALENPLLISFMGPPASFTHLAAQEKFGSSLDYVEEKTITDVFDSVEKSRSDYGVVPIENSTEGTVTHTLDMFIESDLRICSELLFQIEHNLLSKYPLKQLKRIYSNPQVFGQCRLWLEAHCPGVELIESTSTTQAAQIASKEAKSAAIASRLAARQYKLPILKATIQDKVDNVTRFLVIGKQEVDPTGHDKTSILFSVKDRVGVLHSMLAPFRKAKINLTKIESRPTRKKKWEYIFFVDFIGHEKDRSIQRALRELEKSCLMLKVLGSYPTTT